MKKTAIKNTEGWLEFLQELTGATDENINEFKKINQLIDGLNTDEATCKKLKRQIFATSYEIDVAEYKKVDKFRGCLVGGAAGDALGYAVEFQDVNVIWDVYGPKGITEYDLIDGVAQISDDTQMTLFTAEGLLNATGKTVEDYKQSIYQSYISWLYTQNKEFRPGQDGLLSVEELYSRRAPGTTCLSALSSGVMGSVAEPVNNSKGCGGIMRAAPIGLFFDDVEMADELAAETAAITHGHPLGFLPAAALVHMINLLIYYDDMTIIKALNDTQKMLATKYGAVWELADDMMEIQRLLDLALELVFQGRDDLEAFELLGQGWTAEGTLAIAVFCAIKYHDDFEKAIIAASNHNGDSDSTAAVTGNILGAYLGFEAIPQKFIDDLEIKDTILEIADELYDASGTEE